MASPAKLEPAHRDTLPADFDGWDASDPPATLPEDFAEFDTEPAARQAQPPVEKPSHDAPPPDNALPETALETTAPQAALEPTDQPPGPPTDLLGSTTPAAETTDPGLACETTDPDPAGDLTDPDPATKSGAKTKVLGIVAALIALSVVVVLVLHFVSASRPADRHSSSATYAANQQAPQSMPPASPGLAKPSPSVPAEPAPPSPETPEVDAQPASMDPQLNAPARIAKVLKPTPDPGAPAFNSGAMDDIGSGPDSVKGVFGARKGPAVKAESKPISISAGVAEGHLIRKSLPVYPQIARSARVSGTVVVNAVISKTGVPQEVHAIGGPDMLRQAAETAVRSWRYQPYLLNNQPVDVETKIDIIFSINR